MDGERSLPAPSVTALDTAVRTVGRRMRTGTGRTKSSIEDENSKL